MLASLTGILSFLPSAGQISIIREYTVDYIIFKVYTSLHACLLNYVIRYDYIIFRFMFFVFVMSHEILKTAPS